MNIKNQHGAALLILILVITAVGLIMVYTTTYLGLGELDMGYGASETNEVWGITDGCADETLRRIQLNTSYGLGEGTINLNVGNGSCAITVSGSGANRTITVLGTKGVYNKNISIDLTLSGNVITITSWQELSS